ncbi:hypothetical protein PVAG01_07727 [Phlyctema vagabunda]|uniref:Myb-like DNA-binding domain-containing protein n=1 Tax=Phlyctema vagabunda TaxID=108571 RepID=A0ABR4PDR2_9HELO
MASLRRSQNLTNGDAMTRLLYAILKQKCLKDIDWNQVAHDPILAQEITNGHAARMRYSRFKKQMDGTSGVRRQRNPNQTRKKAEKKAKGRQPKQEHGTHFRDDLIVKQEATPDTLLDDIDQSTIEEISSPSLPVVKTEPGLYPYSMLSPSPSPGLGGGQESRNFNDLGQFRGGYEHASSVHLPFYQHAKFGMGNGTSSPITDPYADIWQPDLGQHHSVFVHGLGGGEPVVKQEDRWDDSYHQ